MNKFLNILLIISSCTTQVEHDNTLLYQDKEFINWDMKNNDRAGMTFYANNDFGLYNGNPKKKKDYYDIYYGEPIQWRLSHDTIYTHNEFINFKIISLSIEELILKPIDRENHYYNQKRITFIKSDYQEEIKD